MKNWKSLLAIAMVALVAGCDTVTQPQQLNNGAFIADLTDQIGTPIYFNATNAKVIVGSDYAVNAQDQSGSEFNVAGLQTGQAVPYTVTALQGANVQYYDVRNDQIYDSHLGSCTITITQMSPTLEGSFTAHLVCAAAQDSIRNVTSGSFNAVFQ